MSEAAVTKRGRGRPKGYPKTGGRKKGTPNQTRAELEKLFAVNSKGLARFLFDVTLGRLVKVPDPSAPKKIVKQICAPELRVAAAKVLLAKGWPDLKAVEVTGGGGAPLSVVIDLGKP